MTLFAGLDNRYTSWRKKRRSIKGLPEDLNFETLNSLSNDLLGTGLKEVSYSHLSGWKLTGAYRIYLKTTNGRALSVIFKNALYTRDHIPALEGLAVSPGPAECVVYSQPNPALRKFLPDIYMLREITPRQHFQYLMEDLDRERRRLPRNSKNILIAIEELVGLHNALAEWNPSSTDAFIDYGETFTDSLLEYAQRNIEAYSQAHHDKEVSSILNNWDDLTEVYTSDEFKDPLNAVLIHGDYHPWNIHVARSKRESMIKLIDWEWMGVGRPHADLASLMAQESPELEQQGLERYSKLVPSHSLEEHIRLYEWCRLQRGILDASFLIKQHANTDRVFEWVPRFILKSLKRANLAVKRLT